MLLCRFFVFLPLTARSVGKPAVYEGVENMSKNIYLEYYKERLTEQTNDGNRSEDEDNEVKYGQLFTAPLETS